MKKENKHTAAPWYVHTLGVHDNNPKLIDIAVCYGNDDERICDTVYKMEDAKLIAAAPELLEALKFVDMELSQHPDFHGMGRNNPVYYAVHKARKAIAKAEGK